MKNKIVSKKTISIILVAILLIFTKKTYAADTFSTTITASSVQVKREGTVTVTIGLKDILVESGEKGIGAYTAKIDFDSSVLEYVSTNGSDKWEVPFYQNGLITGNTKDGEVVNTTCNIGTITFKVKKDAKLGETNIRLINFSGSTVANDVDTTDKAVKLTIIGDNNNDNPNGGDTIGGNNNIGGNTIVNNGNNNGNTNGNTNGSANGNTDGNNNGNKPINIVDNSIKNGRLPQTGTVDIIVYVAMGACVVIATIFFIKMRNINIG